MSSSKVYQRSAWVGQVHLGLIPELQPDSFGSFSGHVNFKAILASAKQARNQDAYVPYALSVSLLPKHLCAPRAHHRGPLGPHRSIWSTDGAPDSGLQELRERATERLNTIVEVVRFAMS